MIVEPYCRNYAEDSVEEESEAGEEETEEEDDDEAEEEEEDDYEVAGPKCKSLAIIGELQLNHRIT